MAISIRGTNPSTSTGTGDPTSVTLTGSSQPNTNDVLVIIHCNDFYNFSDMPTPTVGGSSSGVTAITNGSIDGGANQGHIKSWTYVVPSTGDLTVSVDEAAPADEEKGLFVYVLSGVDTATPIDVAGTGSGTSLSHVAPSISPTSSDAFLICHVNSGSGSSGGAYTPPGGMTDQYDIEVASAMSTGGATLQLSASGPTGTKTFTATNNVPYVSLSVAVKTASASASGTQPPFLGRPPGRVSPIGWWTPWQGTENADPIVPPTPTVLSVVGNRLGPTGVVLTQQTRVEETRPPRPTIVTPSARPATTPPPLLSRSTADPAVAADESTPKSYVITPPGQTPPTPPPSVSRMVTDTPIVSFDTPPIAKVIPGPRPIPGPAFLTWRSTADPTPTDTPPRAYVVVPFTPRRFGAVIINQPRVEETTPPRALIPTYPQRRPTGATLLYRSTAPPPAPTDDTPPRALVLTAARLPNAGTLALVRFGQAEPTVVLTPPPFYYDNTISDGSFDGQLSGASYDNTATSGSHDGIATTQHHDETTTTGGLVG